MKYRVQKMEAGKWFTLRCQDMGVDSFETAIAARDYFRATSPECEFRAQQNHPSFGRTWATIGE